MNTNKLIFGTLLGFVGYFMGGFLMYTIVFKDLLASTNPGMSGVQAEPNLIVLVVGNLAASFLLTYIFEKWAGIRTWMSGAISGAMIGALIAFSYDCMLLGTSTLMTWSGVFVDTLVYAIISAIAGALSGWMLGFKRV